MSIHKSDAALPKSSEYAPEGITIQAFHTLVKHVQKLEQAALTLITYVETVERRLEAVEEKLKPEGGIEPPKSSEYASLLRPKGSILMPKGFVLLTKKECIEKLGEFGIRPKSNLTKAQLVQCLENAIEEQEGLLLTRIERYQNKQSKR